MVIHHNGIRLTNQYIMIIFLGLGICVDGLYGNRIEVTSYEFDGVNYKHTLHFTMYDIFGLDSSDITDNYISFAPLWHTCWF